VSIAWYAERCGQGRAPFTAAYFFPVARVAAGRRRMPLCPCTGAWHQRTSMVTSCKWRQWLRLCTFVSQGGGGRRGYAPLFDRPLQSREHAAAITRRSLAFGGGGSRGGKPWWRHPHCRPLPPQQPAPRPPPPHCFPLPPPPLPLPATAGARRCQHVAAERVGFLTPPTSSTAFSG